METRVKRIGYLVLLILLIVFPKGLLAQNIRECSFDLNQKKGTFSSSGWTDVSLSKNEKSEQQLFLSLGYSLYDSLRIGFIGNIISFGNNDNYIKNPEVALRLELLKDLSIDLDLILPIDKSNELGSNLNLYYSFDISWFWERWIFIIGTGLNMYKINSPEKSDISLLMRHIFDLWYGFIMETRSYIIFPNNEISNLKVKYIKWDTEYTVYHKIINNINVFSTLLFFNTFNKGIDERSFLIGVSLSK